MNNIVRIGLLIMCVSVQVANACTTFFLEKNGQMVFGKNYDWMTGTGVVNTNLRGLTKSSLPLEGNNVIRWVSKYGSTTFNQYGKEFPNGGMNEKGLVVELMWLSESEYPAKDQRPGLSVLQWIQYQLDNCESVDQVITTDKAIRITSTGTPQHYLVADAKGKVATIEFLNGKMVVHKGTNLPYPVLANSPYETSLKSYTKPGANTSDRFANACKMVQQYQHTNVNKPLVDYSFDILKKVSQGNFTQWSIVYDITNRKVFFKTNQHQHSKCFSLADFNYACNSTAKTYNMNQNDNGDVGKRFVTFSSDENRKMLKTAFRETGSSINISETLQNSLGEFAASVRCGQS